MQIIREWRPRDGSSPSAAPTSQVVFFDSGYAVGPGREQNAHLVWTMQSEIADYIRRHAMEFDLRP
jgi:hypothetical protein